MISFESDYTEGCIPEILEALNRTNTEQSPGYGTDSHCENARKLIQKAFNTDGDVHFMVGGTITNMTVVASLLKPYQGAICADSGHINAHETGAVESTGHKCLTIPSPDGKICAADAEKMILAQMNDESAEHIVQPGMIYISWPTETGTIYSKEELKALHDVALKYDLPLFVDGARMGYGLAARECDLTMEDFGELTDVFYIGGTKVGALFGEAIVFANKKYGKNFRYMMKRGGGMLAKGRMLGVQFEELFTNNRYLEISKNAMTCAEVLVDALTAKGYGFSYKPQTNQLFVIMKKTKIKELRDQEFAFHVMGHVDEETDVIRLVTSWLTKMENCNALIEAL